MTTKHTREHLAEIAEQSTSWADMMRNLGVKASGGMRKSLRAQTIRFGIDVSHFKHRSPWLKYSDQAIAEAVATSTTMLQVVEKLGARPATGTISHIRRRIATAGIDLAHFPNMDRVGTTLPFTYEELNSTAKRSNSIREMARSLGVPDDGASRSALRRRLIQLGIDLSHFSNARIAIPENRIREAVSASISFAEVMRRLDLEVSNNNHNKIRRRVQTLELDTSHFKRRPQNPGRPTQPRRNSDEILQLLPRSAPRTKNERLRWALEDKGVPYRCAHCRNTGEWRGQPMTLHIDHINGEWLDNRLENLRFLCPNCHAITDTWCRGRRTAIG